MYVILKGKEWREDLRKSKTCIKWPSHCYAGQSFFQKFFLGFVVYE